MMRPDLQRKRVDAILDAQELRHRQYAQTIGDDTEPRRFMSARGMRRRRVEDNLEAADKAVPIVSLEEIIEWHADWVPKPARPLWRKAFLDRFNNGEEIS